jgi:hypothetical protein
VDTIERLRKARHRGERGHSAHTPTEEPDDHVAGIGARPRVLQRSDDSPEDAEALAKVSLITFRATYPGVADDDRWLEDLTEEYLFEEWNKQLTAQAQSELGPVVISEMDGQVVGFATGRWMGEPDLADPAWRLRFVELMELYILPHYQRKPPRHGTRLLLELHRRFDPEKWVVGHVAVRNERARSFMRLLSPYRESEVGKVGLGQGVMVDRATYIFKGPGLRAHLEERAAG